MNIGKNIKLARIQKGYKQKELALLLNISNNYMSLLENNKREPSLKLLRNIAIKLDVYLFHLLRDDIKD